MRIFMILAITAVVVAIGYEAGHAYFAQSHPVSAAASNTMSPHDIHLNYKGMEKLSVHDVKDAF
jgi:methionine-rich copper-binding protein CopC